MSDIAKSLASITPKLRKQLHQSGAELLGKCGIAFEFRYLLGIRRPPSAFLIAGKATDRGVTVDLEHKIQTGELEQESVILDVVRDSVENDPDRDSVEADPNDIAKSNAQIIGETKDKAVRLVKSHHGAIAPTIQPVQVARKFAINMDKFIRMRAKDFHEQADQQSDKQAAKVLNAQAAYLNVAARGGVDFVGEMDIVERYKKDILDDTYGVETLVIRDTKTSSKSPSAETANESHQLSAYSLASSVIDNQLPDAVKLDYLVDLKGGVKPMTIESTRDTQDVRNYLNRIVNAVAAVQSGMFTPAPNAAWWCSAKWCAYHSMCPYVKHKEFSTPLGAEAQKTKENTNVTGVSEV